MKIFSWMRSKRNATNQSHNTTTPQPKSYHDHLVHQSCKKEFSDWPNVLLAIGTFGNNNLEHEEDDQDKTTTTAQDLEEVDRELRLLLNNNHISVDSSFSAENENEDENLSVNQLLDRLRGGGGDAHLKRSNSSVVERGRKDMKSDKRKRGIGKKSLPFLMKKILLCGGGGFVATPPIIRDPLPDPKLDHSTMEKILRAMLHKKIYPQRPTPKKYLEMGERESDDEHDEEACNNTSKWDKTDSEYIVLEI